MANLDNTQLYLDPVKQSTMQNIAGAGEALSERISDWQDRQNERLVKAKNAKVKVFSFADEKLKSDTVGSVDPMSTYANRQKLHYATTILNYAKVPYANQLAEATVRLSQGIATKQQLDDALNKTMTAMIPMEYIDQIVDEINQRIEALNNLIANITAAVAAGAGNFTAANKVEQAKLDMKLMFGQLTIISELIEKISGGLPSSAAGATNIQSAIKILMDALDIITQLITYIERALENLTEEEYERLLALVEALDKSSKKGEKHPGIGEILRTIIVVALDMIRPYITHLMLMLMLECFNAIMKFIKKIPGAGGAFPPPLDLIPPAISLVTMVITGNMEALVRRLGSDIEVISNFLRASVIVGVTSDTRLAEAEEEILQETLKQKKIGISTEEKIATTAQPNSHIEGAKDMNVASEAEEIVDATSELQNIVLTTDDYRAYTALSKQRKIEAKIAKAKVAAEKRRLNAELKQVYARIRSDKANVKNK